MQVEAMNVGGVEEAKHGESSLVIVSLARTSAQQIEEGRCLLSNWCFMKSSQF
jgi:hypothetical protein